MSAVFIIVTVCHSYSWNKGSDFLGMEPVTLVIKNCMLRWCQKLYFSRRPTTRTLSNFPDNRLSGVLLNSAAKKFHLWPASHPDRVK